MSLDWYKCNPSEFFRNTVALTFDQRACLLIVENLIMAQPKGLPANDAFVAGVIGISVRKWNAVKNELILLKKIIVKGGVISTLSTDDLKIKQRLYRDNKAENRSKPNKNNAQESRPCITCEDKKITTNVVKEDTTVSLQQSTEKPILEKLPDKPKRKSRIKADWAASDQDLEYARFRGLQNKEIENEETKFRDYYLSSGASWLDWAIVWKRWIGRYLERSAGQTGRPNATGNRQEPFSRADAAIQNYQDAQVLRFSRGA